MKKTKNSTGKTLQNFCKIKAKFLQIGMNYIEKRNCYKTSDAHEHKDWTVNQENKSQEIQKSVKQTKSEMTRYD